MNSTKKTKIVLLTGVALIFSSQTAQANDILPGGLSNLNNVVVGNSLPQPHVESQNVRITIRPTCYGTNLRSVGNPLRAVNSNKLDFVFRIGSEVSNVRATIGVDQTIDMLKSWTYTMNEAGDITRTGNMNDSLQVSVSQAGSAVNSRVTKAASHNGTVVTIAASFPGEGGYCGGYYSPLMVFFDDKLPLFTGISNFPLNPLSISTYWPEAGAPGYFLVLDRNDDGKITEASELFGNNLDIFKNGFEHLRELDTNQDGVIDWKDEQFAQLQLWRDLNGDGVSQKNELFSLNDKNVKYISLRYNKDRVQPIGARAEFREESMFVFTDKNNQPKAGRIIDVWFGTANERMREMASTNR